MPLRVLTLNVWALPGGLARETDARMRAIGRALGPLAPDVVALQEVWTDSARSTLIEAARTSGYAHAWHRTAAFGGSGLLVLSRRPFGEVRFVSFTATGLAQRVHHADHYGGKGFALIPLETNEGPVVLVDTHLHARYVGPGEPDEYAGIRAAQVIELAAHLARVDGPLVLAGDLNIRPSEPAYRILLGLTGLSDGAAELGSEQATILGAHPYRQASEVDERIDYVLFRSASDRGLQMRSIRRVLDGPAGGSDAPAAYSDHAGLLAELEVTRATARASDHPTTDAIALARRELAGGEGQRAHRLRREALCVGASVLAGGGAALAGRARRRCFLRSVLLTLGGGAFLGGLGGLVLSLWVGRREQLAYDRARETLDAFEAAHSGRDTLPAP